MNRCRFLRALPMVVAVAGAASAQGTEMSGNADRTDPALVGRLHVLWYDPPPGSELEGGTRLFLSAADGSRSELIVTENQLESGDGLLALNRRRVRVEGEGVPGGGNRIRVDRVSLLPEEGGGEERAVTGSQPYVWILCRFADDPSTPQPASWFETQALGPRPSLDHFWREVSFYNIDLLGSDVIDWVDLPHNRSYYVYDILPEDPGDEFDAARFLADVVPLVDSQVHFPTFVGIHFCFNGQLDGWAWGGTTELTVDGETRIYGVTYLPEAGWVDQSIVAHEGGHAFGLPHSSGMYGATYDSDWDVMSHSCGTCIHDDGVYGDQGIHTNAYHKDRLGWIHPVHKYTMPTTPTVVWLWLNDLVVVPPAGRFLLARMPYVADPTSFITIERRRFTGYDENVAGESVVLHEVVPTRNRPAQVIDPDWNGDPNDAGAMWEPGESYWVSGSSVAIVITAEEEDATGTRLTLTNAARSVVYVDRANAGSEDGSSTHPWNTFFEGSGAVFPGGSVQIAPATYGGNLTLRKPATYNRWGSSGVVTIGN